jgi:crotonobetainyl-CoA:carnitine CoA-transferase CaiB-like acyl-CoA transferase
MTNEGAETRGPLSGIRIVDVTNVVFGAYGTSILADLGADVIKVEAPKTPVGGAGGDVMRYPGHPPEGSPPGMGPIFLTINRNKRSVVIDLASEAGRNVLMKLVGTADIFASNMRMTALERYNLGYESLRTLKPDLIYVHCAGYGRGGPYDGKPAYDDVIQAQSGFASLASRIEGGPPRFVPSIIGDKTAGLFMAYATMAALFHRQRTGEGQLVEVPMLECLTSFLLVEHLFDQAFDPPTGDWTYRRIATADRKPYATRDGYIAVMPYSDQNWRDFFELAHADPQLANDPRFDSYEMRARNYLWIYSAIEPLLLRRTTDEWMMLLTEKGIPCARINDLDDLKTDPHLTAVNFFQRREHPDVGPYFAIKHPVQFSATPADIRSDAPRLGQHTEDILREIGLL